MNCTSLKSVIIIGGGVSGLAAGSKLVNSKKFSVTLLEASDRIGGRVFTDTFGGHPVEMGAEWIHGEIGNRVYELICSASPDVPILTPGPFENRYWSGSGYQFITQRGTILDESFNEAVTSLMQTMEDDPDHLFDNALLSKAEVVSRISKAAAPLHSQAVLNSAGLDWIHRYWNSYDASDSWNISSYNGTKNEYLELPGVPNKEWKRPATYSTLLNIILTGQASNMQAADIPEWIQLNRQAIEINYSGIANEPTSVLCKDGTLFSADFLICALPLGVLKERHATLFQPNLSEKMQRAIRDLGFGVVDKMTLEFEEAWWPEDFNGFNVLWEDGDFVKSHWDSDPSAKALLEEYDDIPVWCRNLLGFHAVDGHPKALRTWMTGPVARFVETLDLEYVKITCHKLMKKFMGHVHDIPEPISISRTNWFTNPLFRGSYSYRTVETEKSNVWAADLAKPILNSDGNPIICFAGEATDTHYFSSVHGAYDSGIREANRIIELSSISADS